MVFLIRTPSNASRSIVGVVSHALHEEIELYSLYNRTKVKHALDTKTKRFYPQSCSTTNIVMESTPYVHSTPTLLVQDARFP